MKIKIIENYKEKKFERTLIFADLETVIEDNVHKVVCVSLIKENDLKVKQFKNLQSFMLYLFINCKKSIVYFHNFGRFDSTFILNFIIGQTNKINDIRIIERNNSIYEVFYKKVNISFRDSYLLMNTKLEDVGNTFCKIHKKGEFDYDNITEIFENNPQLIYDQCDLDSLVLKEGFLNFRKLIKDKFDIEICHFLTLPSLAFNLFKKNYYNPTINPIAKNPYETDEFIRRSYKGGISEVFIPCLKDGYCYDANSLYPFSMIDNQFPIGKGVFVKGEEITLDSFIGFIECRVTCDKEINFLTYKHPTRGLITPVGEWTDVYFHKEVEMAIKLGYKIKFLKGFKYCKEASIFKDYVKDLYELRLDSKSDDMKNIAKLLLNSLYGRFGMKVFIEGTKFLNEEELEKMKQKYKINNIHYLGNNLYSLTGIKRSISKKDLYKNSIDSETAVQIASAITAYSRIFMYNFKNIKDNKCYYTDTDSIFLEKKLDEKYIGVELGKFKLEYELESAYFIAPKVYYVRRKDAYVTKKKPKESIILKGLKKEEYKVENVKKVFKSIINQKNEFLKVNRISLFKRDLVKLLTYTEELKIELKFPFMKRIKIFDAKSWISTRAIKIKN